MITRTTAYTIDLDKPTVEDRWDAPLTYGDKGANIIEVTLTRGSAAATLSGLTAMLYGVLSNGTTAFKAGTVAGNVVTCELDYTYYAVPGKMDLLLQLSEGTTVINTPLRITAYVKAGQTSELVSTGEQFSLAELQAIAAACEAATEAIEDMTVAASAVAVGGAPTAAVSDVSGHKHIAFGIPTGATGASITGAAISGADIVFTKSDATSVTLADAVPALTGPQGIQGPAGVMVYSGTAITGTSTTPTAYATGITLAYVGDRYHYNGTTDAQRGNVYKCTLGGDADTALWVYDGNIRGVAGSGSVSTVDGVSPDEDGDVALGALTAADVVDALDSTLTDRPVSAAKAKEMNDKIPAPTINGLAKCNGSGVWSAATPGIDYAKLVTLWEGTWSSGNITVSDINRYTLFLVKVGATMLVCGRVSTFLRGSNTLLTSGNVYTVAMSATIDGTTVTLEGVKAVTHTASGSHSAYTDQSITGIYALN